MPSFRLILLFSLMTSCYSTFVSPSSNSNVESPAKSSGTYIRKRALQLNLSCSIPQFAPKNIWRNYTAYPHYIAESTGGIFENKDFIVVSGFKNDWNETTREVYAFDTANTSFARWRRMDDVPTSVGFSHSGTVVVGNKLYLCGGYVGKNPGKETNVCLSYNHLAPAGKQWKSLPSLPSGRAGGALIYINTTNSLLFATGTTRHDPTNIWHCTDYYSVWELSLASIRGGWKKRPDMPYKGNHASHATVNFFGKERHFVFGGQMGEDEPNGNVKDLVEWNGSKWIRRADMPYGRGHTSSSSFPAGPCGFITAGGAINGNQRSSDIHYYSVVTDTWTKIGTLPAKINTPICGLVDLQDGTYMYCQTGPIKDQFSWRRKIIV